MFNADINLIFIFDLTCTVNFPKPTSMIKCPECRKKISETSGICPYCNHWFYDGEIEKIRNREQRLTQIVLGLIIVILVIIGFKYMYKPSPQKDLPIATTSSVDYTSNPNNIENKSIAYGLAVVDKNGYVSENDLIIRRYANMVKQLDYKYLEDSMQIADMTVSGRNQLIKFGIDQSMLEFMQGINTLYDPHSKSKHYSDYVSLYVVLRSKGLDHSQAFEKLQLLLNSMSMNQIKKSIGVD